MGKLINEQIFSNLYKQHPLFDSKMRTAFRERSSRKIGAIVFVIPPIFCDAREKLFTSSLLYAAWDVSF